MNPSLRWECNPGHKDGVLTRRVFVADALDNGAGYALELGTNKPHEQAASFFTP